MTTKKVYVRSVAQVKCKECLHKVGKGNVYSFGEYISGKWNTFSYGCEHCFNTCAKPMMITFANTNNREIDIIGYHGEQLPEWINLRVDKQ